MPAEAGGGGGVTRAQAGASRAIDGWLGRIPARLKLPFGRVGESIEAKTCHRSADQIKLPGPAGRVYLGRPEGASREGRTVSRLTVAKIGREFPVTLFRRRNTRGNVPGFYPLPIWLPSTPLSGGNACPRDRPGASLPWYMNATCTARIARDSRSRVPNGSAGSQDAAGARSPASID